MRDSVNQFNISGIKKFFGLGIISHAYLNEIKGLSIISKIMLSRELSTI